MTRRRRRSRLVPRTTTFSFKVPSQLSPRRTERQQQQAAKGTRGHRPIGFGQERCSSRPRLRAKPASIQSTNGSHDTSVAAQIAAASNGALKSEAAATGALTMLGLSYQACRRNPTELSSGEAAIADTAAAIATAAASRGSTSSIVLDEFSTTLDRKTAARMCRGLRSFMSAGGVAERPLVVATVHEDVIALLKADAAVDAGRRRVHTLDWSL